MTARDVYCSQHRFFGTHGGGSCSVPQEPRPLALLPGTTGHSGREATGGRTTDLGSGCACPARARRRPLRPSASVTNGACTGCSGAGTAQNRAWRHRPSLSPRSGRSAGAATQDPHPASRPFSPCRPLLEGAGDGDRAAARRVHGRPVRAHGRRPRSSDASEVRPSPARRRPASRPAGPSCHVPCLPPTPLGASRTWQDRQQGPLARPPHDETEANRRLRCPRQAGRERAGTAGTHGEMPSPATNSNNEQQLGSPVGRSQTTSTNRRATQPEHPRGPTVRGRPFDPSPGPPRTAGQERESRTLPRGGHHPEVPPGQMSE